MPFLSSHSYPTKTLHAKRVRSSETPGENSPCSAPLQARQASRGTYLQKAPMDSWVLDCQGRKGSPSPTPSLIRKGNRGPERASKDIKEAQQVLKGLNSHPSLPECLWVTCVTSWSFLLVSLPDGVSSQGEVGLCMQSSYSSAGHSERT